MINESNEIKMTSLALNVGLYFGKNIDYRYLFPNLLKEEMKIKKSFNIFKKENMYIFKRKKNKFR